MLSRVISGFIALAYIVSAYVLGDSDAAFHIALFLMLPVACIWFSEDMGAYTGNLHLPSIQETTPGCVVAFGGWMLLFLPIVSGLVAYYFFGLS